MVTSEKFNNPYGLDRRTQEALQMKFAKQSAPVVYNPVTGISNPAMSKTAPQGAGVQYAPNTGFSPIVRVNTDLTRGMKSFGGSTASLSRESLTEPLGISEFGLDDFDLMNTSGVPTSQPRFGDLTSVLPPEKQGLDLSNLEDAGKTGKGTDYAGWANAAGSVMEGAGSLFGAYTNYRVMKDSRKQVAEKNRQFRFNADNAVTSYNNEIRVKNQGNPNGGRVELKKYGVA